MQILLKDLILVFQAKQSQQLSNQRGFVVCIFGGPSPAFDFQISTL
jgi:hypothetical protein